MILVLKNNADQKKVEDLKKQLTDMGLKLHLSEGMNTSLIGLIGDTTEVDEEWLDTLGGSPVDADGAKEIAAAKVPGADPADITVTTEDGDGRSRYEGELYHDNMKYEFEVDPRTGRIFDWAADWRG